MLGRWRIRVTRTKTDIKAPAGGMVGCYTRGESVGFGFTLPAGASWQP